VETSAEDQNAAPAPAARARTAAPPYVPVDGSPWRLSMGLHRLDLASWLEVDVHRADELAEKSRLLDTARDLVLVTRPAGDAGSRELRDLVVAHLAHLGVVTVSGRQATDVATARTVDLEAGHPLEPASRLAQEDLCVLVRDAEAWRLEAACVCFPSRWSLAEKVGATLAGIHAPVPGFDDALGGPTATFFDRLHADRPVWRLNWTLLDSPELHLPTTKDWRRTAALTHDLGAHLWFRVERQTLRRLPDSGAIAFTIRTYIRPLDDLLATEPSLADALRATLLTVGDDVATYKGWVGLLEPLTAWLDTTAPDPKG
jgi:hypothetical protein